MMRKWIRALLAIAFVFSILLAMQRYVDMQWRIASVLAGVVTGAILIADNIRKKRPDAVESVILTQETPPDISDLDGHDLS